MAPPLTVAAINALSVDDFVAVFGAVLEDSPHLVALVADERPFAGPASVGDAFAAVVADLDPDAATTLLRAHPELGADGPMATTSRDEQAAAGIGGAGAELRTRLAEGNAAYRARFGFPFVLAVADRRPAEIVAELDRRLARDADTEMATALDQVATIARRRVAPMIGAR